MTEQKQNLSQFTSLILPRGRDYLNGIFHACILLK